MGFNLTYKSYGLQAVLIEWPQKIDRTILLDVLAFKAKISSEYTPRLQSLNHAYASILVVLSEQMFDFNSEVKVLETLYNTLETNTQKNRVLWKIPVCYDPCFGLDLEALSKDKNLNIEHIVELHIKPMYTVYFVGFLPGFLYLGGLNKTLFTPRRDTPRLKVQKGAVAIGGAQTGIYPSESPGGWQIIGNSPIDFFNITNENPCFAKAGDALKFYPVSFKTYNDIKTLVDAGVYQLESEVMDD